jgi:hypothetical protein
VTEHEGVIYNLQFAIDDEFQEFQTFHNSKRSEMAHPHCVFRFSGIFGVHGISGFQVQCHIQNPRFQIKNRVFFRESVPDAQF